MSAPAGVSGRWGEARAADLYARNGYVLIETNYHSRYGEIDIILARPEKRLLVFAEVKLRKSSAFAAAAEFVDGKKQERLRKTALIWLSEHPEHGDDDARFDVVEIYAAHGAQTKSAETIINIIENAF